MRHAIPDNTLLIDDNKRPLSQQGQYIQLKMAQLLLQQGYHIDQLYYSPTERTKMTARIVEEVFQVTAIEEPLLRIDANPQALYEKIRSHTASTVALVGHAPSLFELTHLCIQKSAPSFQLEPSGVLILRTDDTTTWEYLSPNSLLH